LKLLNLQGEDDHVGATRGFAQGGGEVDGFWQNAAGVGGGEFVVDDHAHAIPGQGTGEFDAHGGFGDVGAALVGQAQDGDGAMGGKFGQGEVGDAGDLAAVDHVGGDDDFGLGADLPGHAGEGFVVAWEAGAAEAAAAFEIFAADAGIGAHGAGDDIDVGAFEAFADFGQHVGKGDFGGDEGVEGNFRELGVDEVHAVDLRLAVADGSVQRGEDGAGLGVAFADEQEVGVEEVADDGAQGDEGGVVAEAEIGSSAFAGKFFEQGQEDAATGAGHDGAGEGEEVAGGFLLEGAADVFGGGEDVGIGEDALGIARRGNDEEGDVGGADGGGNVVCSGEAGGVFCDEVGEAGFVHGGLAAGEGLDGGGVKVHPDNGVAFVGHDGGEGGAEFP